MEYELYQAYRTGGKRAVDAFNLWREAEARLKARRASMDAPTVMIDGLIGVMVGIVINQLLRGFLGLDGGKLWIQSPSGKTMEELPLPTALRIIRRKNWDFAQVEPVKPIKIITRKDALRILLFGSEMYKEMTTRRHNGI